MQGSERTVTMAASSRAEGAAASPEYSSSASSVSGTALTASRKPIQSAGGQEDNFIQDVDDGDDLQYGSPYTEYAEKLHEVPEPAAPPRAHQGRSQRPKGTSEVKKASSQQQRLRMIEMPRAQWRLQTVPVMLWTPLDVGMWITRVGCKAVKATFAPASKWCKAGPVAQHAHAFVHNAVDGEQLLQLDDQALRADLRIAPWGHRRKIMLAIQQLTIALEQTTGKQYERGAGQPARADQWASAYFTAD